LSTLSKLLVGLLPLVPRPIVRKVASRYVAGARVEDALHTVAVLNAEGAMGTIDILGEEVTERERAEQFTRQYVELFRHIAQGGANSNVSVKLSMLGLDIDEDYCRGNLERIFAAAHAQGNWVTIDMEDHTATDATLKLYRAMLAQFAAGGTVLQAYLRRTLDDIAALPERSNIRLCKGIYVEPESIALKDRQEIRDNFMAALARLIERGMYVGIATHDVWLIDRAERLIADKGLAREHYEFQMLLGVEPALRRRIIASGHPMRVYVPFGKDWYPYSVRRLRENPAVAGHVLRALLGMKQK
jgi:proline dehydrogenase